MGYLHLVQKIWPCAVSDLADISSGNIKNYDLLPKNNTMQEGTEKLKKSGYPQ
jgi:hypothetical protein